MGMIGANELKKKMFIVADGHPNLILDVTFASPSARGASTMVRVKIRNLMNGAVLEKNCRTSEKFEEADVEKGPASFMYSDADGYYFMDDTSFEQFSFSPDKIADVKGYIKEGTPMQVIKYNGQPVSLEFPVYVELKVTYTEPSVKGDSAGNVLKMAQLETGIEVKVPQYVKEGDLVRVNTQTGEVSGRA